MALADCPPRTYLGSFVYLPKSPHSVLDATGRGSYPYGVGDYSDLSASMSHVDQMQQKFSDRNAVAGVIGLGYVGLPLAVAMGRAGFRVLGLDVSTEVVATINQGRSHIQDTSSEDVAALVRDKKFSATVDAARLRECDVISICVPTPLNKTKDPELSYVVAAAEVVAASLRPGQLVILESTTYPGTTREVLLPALERTGLKVGVDIFLCFSPERVDPGNAKWHTVNTPKVVGGVTPACLEMIQGFYGKVFDTLVPVSSAEAAELTKVYENTFRMINIALANELAQACDVLGIDVWEVVEAAGTKPFGFMKFTPGPGLGGHCIPLDPHYLSWKMRTLNYKTRMIELASEVNAEMPEFVVRKVADALNDDGKAVRGSRVLVLGVAYKKDIDDLRESPGLDILKLLQDRGAEVVFHDPHCAEIRDDGHTPIRGLPLFSVPLDRARLEATDAVVIVTDHTRAVVDTRGVMRRVRAPQARVIGLSLTGARG